MFWIESRNYSMKNTMEMVGGCFLWIHKMTFRSLYCERLAMCPIGRGGIWWLGKRGTRSSLKGCQEISHQDKSFLA